MNPLDYVEDAIKNLEKTLKLPITIVDNDGWFNTRHKVKIFNEHRKTHRKNPLCGIGFDDNCRANCRYKLNALCMSDPRAHYSVCWKNLAQIAVPLRHNNFHYGVLYAGIFRPANGEPPQGLPEEFYLEYQKLPVADPEKIESVTRMLSIFARGIIDYLCAETILNFDYDSRIHQLIDFLELNHAESVSLIDASEILELTPAYASSFIKQATGQNFSQLLRSIRISHVRKMLVSTEDNLHLIARSCGFANEFHLSKVFKQYTGDTPSEFRKKNHAPLTLVK